MPIRVALFGGSFNPPHLGHAQVVLTLLHSGFDEVWAVPAEVHPFGKDLIPFQLRARMLGLALSDFGARVRISLVESELPGPSRTFDTVTELIRRHPGVSFTLALGEDQKVDLPRWHRIDELRDLVPFHFVGRGIWTPGDPVVRIPDYSSSEMRRRFAQGHPPREFLHERVCEFITAHGLYGPLPMTPPAPPRVAIIGQGRVGGSLLTTLCAAGVPPVWCADPDPERTADARGRAVPVFDDWSAAYQADSQVDFLLFCTPDDWRPRARTDFWTTSPVCLHSGGMHRPADVFAELGVPLGRTGILHPARSVASARTNLSGSVFSVTGYTPVLSALVPLLELLQATPVPVAEDDRMTFHAICVLVANGSQILEQDAADLLDRLGTDSEAAHRLVRQLVLDSLEAWSLLGRAGLTGPWARRDEVTAVAHLAELVRLEPGTAELYAELKREAGRLEDRTLTVNSEAGSGGPNPLGKP